MSPREQEKQQKIIRDQKIKAKIEKTMKAIEDSAIPQSKKELYALAANQAKRQRKTEIETEESKKLQEEIGFVTPQFEKQMQAQKVVRERVVQQPEGTMSPTTQQEGTYEEETGTVTQG